MTNENGAALEIIPTTLEGVFELRPGVVEDHRGWFRETFNVAAMEAAGLPTVYAQDNESVSVAVGTLRGLHYQLSPYAQAKLVRVVHGSVFDVAVDLRRSSPTFGSHTALTLTATEGNQMFIPAGFGHGFVTLEANTRIAYKVSGPYAPGSARAVHWDDPAIGIDWPVRPGTEHLSQKDLDAPPLDAADVFA